MKKFYIISPIISASCLFLTGYMLYKKSAKNMIDIIIEEIETIK